MKSHKICIYLFAERHTLSFFGEISYKFTPSSALNTSQRTKYYICRHRTVNTQPVKKMVS